MNNLNKQLFLRRLFLIIIDIICINMAGYIALIIRYDFSIGNIDHIFSQRITDYAIFHTVITLIIFVLFHMYNSLWEFASIEDLTNILLSCITISKLHNLYYKVQSLCYN